MQLLLQFHPVAAQYLQGIPPQTWVTALYPGPHYGHKTSNVVESMNKVFKETRELPILELLDTIWHYVMNHRFQRLNKALTCETLHTPWCYEHLLNARKWAHANVVQVSSPTSGIVRQANSHTFIVDLITKTCTCGHFQENQIPCGHVFSFVSTLQSCIPDHCTPRDYIPKFFLSETWQKTYFSNFSPISLMDISMSHEISAPKKERKVQGRPKVKRYIAGEQRKVSQAQAQLNGQDLAPEKGEGSQACRNCGQYGHNRITCTVEEVV